MRRSGDTVFCTVACQVFGYDWKSGGGAGVYEPPSAAKCAHSSYAPTIHCTDATAKQLLVTGNAVGVVAAFDTGSKECCWESRHFGSVHSVAATCPPPGKSKGGGANRLVFSCGDDNALRAWRADDGSSAWTSQHHEPIRCVVTSPDADGVVIACGFDGFVRAFAQADGKLLWEVQHGGERRRHATVP